MIAAQKSMRGTHGLQRFGLGFDPVAALMKRGDESQVPVCTAHGFDVRGLPG